MRIVDAHQTKAIEAIRIGDWNKHHMRPCHSMTNEQVTVLFLKNAFQCFQKRVCATNVS